MPASSTSATMSRIASIPTTAGVPLMNRRMPGAGR